MSNFNYMDNVPVKISENYRPLPRVYQLPLAIAHKLALSVDHYDKAPQFKYDFQLEHILLQKLPEWRHVRQRQKDARRERMRKRAEERQRMFEEEQKQLLGAVSYPSAEELSSCSSDENEDEQPATAVTNNNFHNILQPTILTPTTTTTTSNGYVAKKTGSFNYQDFEGSSSPFDEIELKTINDLDILAQVLHNTQLIAVTAKKNAAEDTQNNADTEPAKDEVEVEELNIPNEREIITTSYHVLQQQEELRANSQTHHQPQFFYNGLTQIQTNPYYNLDTTTITSKINHVSNKNSKSVPDILKVLKEEKLKWQRSEILAEEPAEKKDEVDEERSQTRNKNFVKQSIELEKRPSYYSQLEESIKQMVKNISIMGFPLEQVSRIALLYGADDKKIVEHLISLNELRVLGFEEERISNALLKCENNKEKALELLIS